MRRPRLATLLVTLAFVVCLGSSTEGGAAASRLPQVPAHTVPFQSEDPAFGFAYPSSWILAERRWDNHSEEKFDLRVEMRASGSESVLLHVWRGVPKFTQEELFARFIQPFVDPSAVAGKLDAVASVATYAVDLAEADEGTAVVYVALLCSDAVYRFRYAALGESGQYESYRTMLGSFRCGDILGSAPQPGLEVPPIPELPLVADIGPLAAVTQTCTLHIKNNDGTWRDQTFWDPTPNHYDCTQCTWWASYSRPDIPDVWAPGDNNAYRWYYHAAEDPDFEVSDSPAPGAIAVWDVSASNPFGHVAYVTWVEGGAFHVTENNYDGKDQGHFRVYKFSDTQSIRFILGGIALFEDADFSGRWTRIVGNVPDWEYEAPWLPSSVFLPAGWDTILYRYTDYEPSSYRHRWGDTSIDALESSFWNLELDYYSDGHKMNDWIGSIATSSTSCLLVPSDFGVVEEAAATDSDCAPPDPLPEPPVDPPPSTSDAAIEVHELPPDNITLPPGVTATKVWRVHNTGTTTWGSGYQLAFVGGHQLGAPSPIGVPAAAPGQEANLSINIVAPTAAGEYMGYWRLRNPQGTYFGPTLSVRINVQSAGSHITVLSVDPPSPADTSSVQIRVKVEGFPNLRATRLLIDGAVKYEIGGPEFAYTWLTNGYAAGDHSVVVEVADQTDTSWSHPERRAVTYRLTGTGAAPNHRPNAPTLTSPYDWYVYYSGNTAQLCAQANGDPDGDAITAYYFDIYDSAQTWNSGWVGGNCVTTAALGPYTYQWRVKVRDSRGAESDWSAPWHFTLVNPSLSITELYFQPQDADSEVVRIRACTAGLGGVGITMRVSVNDANDGSANGTWHIIKELGVPCFTEADAPLWRTLEFGTGTHRVRVEAHGADASWNGAAVREATYALPHRRPPSPPLVAPVPLSQNTRDSVYLNSRTVKLRWAPSLRATSYTLHVGTSPSPAGAASPLLRQTFSSGVTEATHTFSDDHPVLYWQVTAANDKGSNTSGDQQIGIDRTPPSCSVQPLPDVSYENVCQVVWGGTDSVSGIRSYAVRYLDSGRSDWVDWLTDVPAAKTYDLFVGQPGHTYSFRCRATDRANNVGTYPSAADTSIKVDPAARPTTPWWNTSYTGKRNITVQNNTTSSALPAGYPVNLRFDAGTSPTAAELYAASASPTKCDDLRIVASDTTQLHRVVKACSPTLIEIWFRTQVAVPAGGTNANSHQLYYGSTNPGALLADPNQVWYPYDEADTQYLFLFQEGSGATAYDSSGYGRHCSINPTVVWTTAKFGTGLRFNRANNGDSPSLTCGSAVLPSFTIEFWFRPDADGDGRIAGQIKQGVGPNWLLNLFEGKLRLDVWPCTTCGSSEVRSNANLRQAPYVGVWNHVAVSFNGGNEVRFYINGALDSVKVLNQTGLTQYDIPLEIGSVEGIGQLKDSLGAFRISSGVKTSFAYGPFGAITGEPSAVVGSVVNRPVSGTPDLQVLSLTAYPNPSGGILAEAVLRNAGTLSTQNGFFIDLYLNHTPTGPGDYTGSVQMWVNEPIAAGKTVTVTGVVSDVGGLAQAAAGATYSEVSGTLRVFADSSGAVAESSETNNLDPLGVEVCVASADSFEEDDTAATARALVLDEPQVHNFDGPGDGDWLRFTAQAGKAYVIETSNLGPATDTYLYLYGADGTTLLASNDDDGSTLASRIEWTAPADGTFYVLIKHWNPNVGGCGAGYTVGATLQRPAFRVLLPAVLRAYTPPRPTHTLRLTSLPGDGEIVNVECADWQTCRTASAGNFLLDEYPAATVAASAYSGLFDIKRVYLTFDASALPDNSDVVSATLSLHIGSWVNGNHGIVVVPSSHGSSLWPTDFGQPLETTTSEFLASSDQWVHIPLVGSDASWIGMDAYAGVILVHSYDFSGQQPTGLNDIVVSLSESDTFAPYLTIHYQDER